MLVLGFVAAACAAPAQGCVAVPRPISLSDFRDADLVIVGRITRYEIIPDIADIPKAQWRERRRTLLLDGFMGGHARVEILVDEALLGSAPRHLRANWPPTALYGLLDEPPHGRVLMGLFHSAPFFPNGPPVPSTIVQPGCSEGFVFDNAGAKADSARRMLGLRPRGTITDALTSPAILLGNAAIFVLGLIAWGIAASLRQWRRSQELHPQGKKGLLAAVSRQIGPSSLD